jgi:MFS transporter, DHA2 family, triacylglyceride efflux pump
MLVPRRVRQSRAAAVSTEHRRGRVGSGLALAALSAGVFVSGLDQTVVVAVLPRIVTDLNVPITDLDKASWIVTAYLLGYTVAMPLLGRAADVHGYRILFLVCAGLFALGSWLAAIAPGLWSLVAARAVQAAGGGGMVPVALAAAAFLYRGRARLLALGVVAGAAEAGAVLGPLYGAVMIHELGWRAIFWVNLPVVALLVVSAGRILHAGSLARGRVDYAGGLLIGLSLLALTLGLSGGTGDFLEGHRALLDVTAAVLALAFVAREARARWPLLSLELFRRAPFASANAANLFIGAALIVALVEVPLFATTVLSRSDAAGGLMLLRLTALIPVGALVGGWLAARLPYPVAASGGMLVSALGFLRLSGWGTAVSEPRLFIDLGLTGLGFGLVLAPLAGAVLGAARDGNETVGAASLTIARMIGMMVGLSALTTWGLGEFERRVARHPLPLPAPGQSEDAYKILLERYEQAVKAAGVFVFDRLFLVAAAFCVIAAIISLLLRRSREAA